MENFNICEQNYIMETMETQFPAFIAVEVVESPHNNYAVYSYRTNATKQRLIKWVNIFFLEHEMLPERDVSVLSQGNQLRLISEGNPKFALTCN